MKPTLSLLTTGAAASVLALSAFAADQTDPNTTTKRSYERQQAGNTDRLGRTSKVSDLIGMEIRNQQNEKVGKVEDVLVDLQAGRVVQVVISSGGFLGLGDELSVVPPSALRSGTEDKVLMLDVNKETLAKAPHFKRGEWPDFNDPVYSIRSYQVYRVEPYFRTNAASADNTRLNVRDRQQENLTPFDQGSGETDVDLTRQIRREILNQKNLSVNARNVKVITVNGRVTLRGPVNSEEEKRVLAEIASRVASREHVDNQLEVKQSEVK